MKNNTLIFLGISLTMLMLKTSAQDWVGMMENPAVNVHDVQDSFNKWYELHKSKQGTDLTDRRMGKDELDNQGYELYRRWEHQMLPRTFPSGIRPDPASIANEYKEYIDLKHKANSHEVNSATNWSYVGNTSVPVYGGDGRVNRIHFYPGNSNIIYACTPTGGLWKSVNGGVTWATNTDELADLAISDIAINPLKPSIMYLGTGDNDAGSTSTIGVLRSNDGGITWNATGMSYTMQTSGPAYMVVNQLIFNPADTATIFAATSFGLYYSKNDGNSWALTINDNIKDVAFEPFHSATVYACSYTGKYYRSTDSGKTFLRISNGLPTKGMERMAIGTTASDSNTVYLLAVDSANYGFYGLYRSIDRGQTFTAKALRSSGAPNLLGWSTTGSDSSGQAWYNLAIMVSPTNPDSIFVAGSFLWLSIDGGSTWTFNTNVYNYVHIDIHSILLFPGSSSSFLMSSDGGVFKTPDAGNTWTDLSNDLEIAQQYSIGPSADNSSLWLTGWQDNGSNISLPSWQIVYGGDGMTCFIDNTNDNDMYASYEEGNFAVSSDGGASWNIANNGITESGDWDTPWLQDPKIPNKLFSGFQNVWVSNNQGTTWSRISSWGSYYINSLAVAPSNDQYIYASEYFALYTTSNEGATWNNITGSLPVGYVSISAIAINPNNPMNIWVTFSGWNSAYKVFESTDGGSSWVNISTGLPNLPVNCIVYQEGTPDGIYVGTDIGVYYKDNTTGGWVSFNAGLPNVQVTDLQIYAPGNLLDAATYGRGTWQTKTYITVGIDEIKATSSLKVYPNPSNGIFTIQLSSVNTPSSIEIYNVLGEKVYQTKLKQENTQINLSDESESMYFYRVIAENGSLIGDGKLIIQK